MIAIPVTLLALAAGVYLLIYVKQVGLGQLYKALAWTVVLLSFLFLVCCVVRGARHHRHMRQCHESGQCSMGRGGDGACPYMKEGAGCCAKDGHAECDMAAKGCSKDSTGGNAPCCKKGGEDGKAACCKKDGDGAKPACCKKMAADSTAKK